jgi:hypothetical protein
MSKIIEKRKKAIKRIRELQEQLDGRGIFVNLAPDLEGLTLVQLDELDKWLSTRLGATSGQT